MSAKQRDRSASGRSVSHENSLPTWEEVRLEWNRRSGENLSRGHVSKIAWNVNAKLRDALRGIARDLGILDG
jgi:hypothetical protein